MPSDGGGDHVAEGVLVGVPVAVGELDGVPVGLHVGVAGNSDGDSWQEATDKRLSHARSVVAAQAARKWGIAHKDVAERSAQVRRPDPWAT